jgi:hypothetical protein
VGFSPASQARRDRNSLPRNRFRNSDKCIGAPLSSEANAASQGADRSITWQPWQAWADYWVQIGDRYLGGERWEQYLGFELYRSSAKKIKISMIFLGTEVVPDVVIAPGRRHAIVKVTNSDMTADMGRWRWTTEEVQSTSRLSHPGLIE